MATGRNNDGQARRGEARHGMARLCLVPSPRLLLKVLFEKLFAMN